ncbi:MAG: SCO family protein [Thermoanaerobaculia bacterium]
MKRVGAGAVGLLLLAASSAAKTPPATPPGPLPEVAFEQRLGETLPLDGRWTDSEGRTSTLSELFHGRPAVLAFVYYDCPMLCGMTLAGLAKSLKPVDLEPGKDFEVLIVSFDPSETPTQAAERKDQTLSQYGRRDTAAGWHFLTGDAPTIEAITSAAGFQYSRDEKTGDWAHAAGLLVLTPEGEISKTFFGIEYPSRDVRLGLVEAGEGTIGTVVDQVLLLCYHYDPVSGKYSFATLTAIRVGGILTLAALVGFAWISIRKERGGAAKDS